MKQMVKINNPSGNRVNTTTLQTLETISEQPTSLVARLVAWWSELLTTSHEVPFLPWEFFLAGEDPHSDHGLGSM
jgi:hypothetical protein